MNTLNITTATATGTILNDDAPAGDVIVSIADARVGEGDGSVTLTARFSRTVSQDVTLGITYQDGTATFSDDLSGTPPRTVTIPANRLSADFTVSIRNDTVDEPEEALTVSLGGSNLPPGENFVFDGSSHRATLTIIDNDPPVGTATVSIANESVAENVSGGNAEFTVSVTTTVTSDVVLAVAYAAGTATLATDLGTRPTTVTIDQGQTEATLRVPITNDIIVEGDETFTVTLSEGDTPLPEGVEIGTDATATGTITNDDEAEVSIAPEADTQTEGGSFAFEVRLSAPVDEAVNVTWTATAGTAAVQDPNSDLADGQDITGTATFTAGTTTAVAVPINTLDDPLVEGEEAFTVALTGTLPDGVDYGTRTATATITDNDVAPQITTQPTDQSVTVGGSATFTVTATGTPTPTYQWRFEGSDIAGATSASYAISNAALTNAGDYTVVVTNTAGTVTSSAATLTVTPAAVAPQITTQPTDQSVTVGGSATFTVTATGTPTPTYQWRFEGSDIAGATSASYAISNAALTNAGDYTVVVTNTAGTVTSTAATLTVTAAVNATVSIAAASALENVSGGNAEFTVSLTTAVNEDVTLAVAYAAGDTNPVVLATDLGTRPTTVTIDQGQTSATLLVPIIDDSIVESDETFTVTISEGTTSLPTGVTIGTNSTATGTITNDDTAVLGFTGSSTVFPTEGQTSTFTVSFLSSGATGAAVPVTLTWTVVPDEDDDDPGQLADLNPTSGTVTIPAGQSSADITITAVDDTDDEPSTEAFLIQLGLSTASPLPPDVSLVASSNAAYEREIRLIDNDLPPDITVSIGDISVAENVSGGMAQFTITLSERRLDSLRFELTFEPGDTNPVVLADDLGDLPTETVIGGGNLTRTVNVPIINDELVEGDEIFTVTIAHDGGGGGNVTLTKDTATGTIVDDDDPPPPEATVSIGNASVAENDGNAEFTVSLTQAVDSDVTVAVAYAAGTATLGTDLGTRPTTVTIDEGDTEATLEVPIFNDEIVEGDEDFTVTISEGTTSLPEGVTIGTDATGTGTITDNDEAEVTLGTDTLTAAENGTFTYTVSLSKAADEAVTVRWTATDGTAMVDDDLQEQTNTVTFPANDNTAQEFTISPVDDNDEEGDETFTVTLEADTAGTNPLPTGVTIGASNSSTATITDNDAPTGPDLTVDGVSVSSASVVEGASFTINATVNNGGNAASAATTLTYYRSTDATITTGDISIGTDAVGALAASGSSTQDASVSIATAGTYHVGACVPTVSGETDTDNNCSTGVQVTVTAAAVAPQITTQPTNQSVTVGGSATFTVVATGTPTPTYQWRFEGSDISGATSETYTLSNAALTDAGDYTVVVTNTAGTVTSNAATLTVTPAPPATAPDLTVDDVSVSSASVVEGASFTINATVNNEGDAASAATTLTYYRSTDATITTGDTSIGTDAVGALAASGSSTQDASVSIATAGTYHVGACVPTVSGETDTDNNCSTGVQVTVTAAAVAPQITTQPTDQSVTVGENATFTVTATGTPTPTYQWRFEGSDISGATSASYTLSSAALTNAGDYTVVVTNTAGTVTSNAATLTVTPAAVAPQITTQPTDRSVTVGETATFTVTATGTPTPTYQWRLEGSDISGATSASYAISNAALTDAGDYTVVVTNTAGTVTSSAATLTVTPAAVAPQITTQPTDQSVTVGGSATFTVTATGTPTPTYQWRFEGSDISGATSASYTLSNAALTNAGDYTVVVTNTAGTVTSSAATLTVTPAAVAPQITTQPTDQSVTVGGSATFTVAATGTPTPTYQWRFEGSDIAGATSASYAISNAALTNAGDYTVVVTNTAGTVTSSAATLTVNDEAAPPASRLSVLIEPRLIGAGTALRRHAGRFDRMTGTVVRNRLDGRAMKTLTASQDLGSGAVAVGGSFDHDRFDQGRLDQRRWGAWIDGAWAGFDGKATGRQADIHGGVDYLAPDGNWLIGALIGHEVADLDIGRATYRSQYTHVGVYGGARLWQHLLFDGAVSYGRATPDIALGDVSASHDANRITARGALTGDFGFAYGLWAGSVRVEPQLGVLYSRERLGAFTDSAGGVAGRETLELGRFSAGPRLTWAFDGGRLTGGARVQWDFLQLEDGVSAAADIGVTLDLAPNVTLGVQGDVDGIGIGDGFGSLGGTVELKARF